MVKARWLRVVKARGLRTVKKRGLRVVKARCSKSDEGSGPTKDRAKRLTDVKLTRPHTLYPPPSFSANLFSYKKVVDVHLD